MATTDEQGYYSRTVFSGCTYRVDPYFDMKYPTSNPAAHEVAVGPGQRVVCDFTLNRSWAPSVTVSPPDGAVIGNRYDVTVALRWQAGVSTPVSLKLNTAEDPHHLPFLHSQTLYEGPLGDLGAYTTYQLDTNGVTQATTILTYPWETIQCRNQVYKLSAQVEFLYPYDDGPSPVMKSNVQLPVVRNIVIRDVVAHPGAGGENPDYVLFDPDGPTEYRTPHLVFKIVDDGFPLGPYTWTVYLRDLGDGDWQNGDYATITGTAGEPATVTAVINGAVQGQTQSQPLTAKGVYAFDIRAQETNPLQSDDAWDRWPYKLQVGLDGFDLRFERDGEGRLCAKVDYELTDSIGKNATKVSCVLLAPDFSKVDTLEDLGTTVGVAYQDQLLHTFAPGSEQPGTYYAVLCAEDGHGTDQPIANENPRYYRERGVNKRMVAVGDIAVDARPGVEIVEPDEAPAGNQLPVRVRACFSPADSPLTHLLVTASCVDRDQQFVLYDGDGAELPVIDEFAAGGVTFQIKELLVEWNTTNCWNRSYRVWAQGTFGVPPQPVVADEDEVLKPIRNFVGSGGSSSSEGGFQTMSGSGGAGGNPDYFVYDPDSEDESKRRPYFEIGILDEGTAGLFDWYVSVGVSSDGQSIGTEVARLHSTWRFALGELPERVYVQTAEHDPEDWRYFQDRPLPATKAIYTFEIKFDEYGDNGQNDAQFLRAPTLLQVSEFDWQFERQDGAWNVLLDLEMSDTLGASAVSRLGFALLDDALEPFVTFRLATGLPWAGHDVVVGSLSDEEVSRRLVHGILLAEDDHGDDEPAENPHAPGAYRDEANRRMFAVVREGGDEIPWVTLVLPDPGGVPDPPPGLTPGNEYVWETHCYTVFAGEFTETEDIGRLVIPTAAAVLDGDVEVARQLSGFDGGLVSRLPNSIRRVDNVADGGQVKPAYELLASAGPFGGTDWDAFTGLCAVGMPESVDGFGPKTVRLLNSGLALEPPAEARIEVFFDGGLRNHPAGGPPGYQWWGQGEGANGYIVGEVETPNWFYYYSQLHGRSDVWYGFDLADALLGDPQNSWYWPGSDHVNLSDDVLLGNADVYERVWYTQYFDRVLGYICFEYTHGLDAFKRAVVHEVAHKTCFDAIAAGLADTDADQVPDAWEPDAGLVVGTDDTHVAGIDTGDGPPDCEYFASELEHQAGVSEAGSSDWANGPGLQHGRKPEPEWLREIEAFPRWCP